RLAAAETARPCSRWMHLGQALARLGRSSAARWAVAAVALLAIGAQVGRGALRPRPCAGGPARLAGAWGPADVAAARRAFLASGKASTASAFEAVRARLDDHARRWQEAYTDACEATQVRGEQSAEVLDLRMACLDDDLSAMSALARVLSGA